MQQGYNLMTEKYNKKHYEDDDFVEKVSIVKFIRLLDESDKRIDTQIEVYGIEELLHFLGEEEGIRTLKSYFDEGIEYLTENYAFIKIITRNKISVWQGTPFLNYKNNRYPLTKLFGTSLRQQETEYWTANININS